MSRLPMGCDLNLEYSLDPISLLTAGVGLLGGIFAKGAGGGANPAPTPVPAAPAPAQSPQGSATTNKPTTAPSFLSAAAAPTQGNTTGGKTLLGA